MEVFLTIHEIKVYLFDLIAAGKTIGLVPTMGALHKGHLSLIEESVNNNDVTVTSIFVNPTQFNNEEDFENYPKNDQNDLNVLEQSGNDVVFIPSYQEMYREGENVLVEFRALSNILEGKYRPGHFAGVALVVAKLFNIINPTNAYFGQKDLQQCLIIKKLNENLLFGININMMPIIRDSDGLALSSRNERLTENEKTVASQLYKCIRLAAELLLEGNSITSVRGSIISKMSNSREIDLEYFEIVSSDTLRSASGDDINIAICISAYINGIRLIDNTLLTLGRK